MKLTRFAAIGAVPRDIIDALIAAGATPVDASAADFWIQFEGDPVPGPHPPAGLWRLSGAGPEPLGFWHVYDGDFHMELRLERRTPPSCFLERRWIEVDRLSYGRTAANALAEMAAMVVHAARLGPGEDVCPVEFPPRQQMAPSAFNRAWLRMKVASRFAVEQWRGTWFAESWKVGVIEAPVTEFLDMGYQPKIRWLAPPSAKRFLADPFLVRLPEGWLMLAEDFDFDTNLGRIAHEFSATGEFTGKPQDAIVEPCHMSYPFPLEFNGELYCIPETHQLNGVFLWRWDSGSRSWKERRQILEGRWLDPTIFFYEGRWWLFATNKDDGPDRKLFAFFADGPSGPWRPHLRNPVKIDVRSSRPGGMPFVEGGRLYRPAQDSSKHYGWRMTVNLVTRLAPEEFAEEAIRVIDSDRLGLSGVHTLSGAGGRTLIDGWQPRFVPSRAVRVLWHKLRRVAGA